MKPKSAPKTPRIENMEVEKKVKTTRVYPKIDEKHAAFAALVKGGVDKRKAAEVLGYKPNKAYDLARRVEKKGHKLDVASESMVRLAHRAVKNCLKGKPWGAIETIKDSTALAAAQVVVDRHQPKNQENTPPTFTFTRVDLDQFRMPPLESEKVDPVPIASDEVAGHESSEIYKGTASDGDPQLTE
jgi:hypothetical protein